MSGEWVFGASTVIILLLFDTFVLPDECCCCCCCWCCWCCVVEFELLEHGLPSLTSTGTATRLGELADCWIFLFCLVFYLFLFFLIKHTWLCWFCSAIAFSFACLLHLYLWFWNQIFTWKKTNKKFLIRSRKDYEKFPSTAQSVFFLSISQKIINPTNIKKRDK